MGLTPYFLTVDDDPLNNKICQLTIKSKSCLPNAVVQSHTMPEYALEDIGKQYNNDTAPLTILLLDINMPGLTGWEFLEEFEQMDEKIKGHFKIYILSSSIDQRDIDRAERNKSIEGFISKPITCKYILQIHERFFS